MPPALGLIRSADAGKTWTSVSELGTADFHAIEPSGDRLIGGLFGQAQVLVSGDDGRSWETRAAPRPLVDLEVNPADPSKWIASTADGVYVTATRAAPGARSTRRRAPTSPGPRPTRSTGSTRAAR